MHHRVCYSVGGVLSFVGVLSCVAYGSWHVMCHVAGLFLPGPFGQLQAHLVTWTM